MRSWIVGFFLAMLLWQCEFADIEQSTDTQLVGTWQNTDTHHVIHFDQDGTYTVLFGNDTAFYFTYHVADQHLFIHDEADSDVYLYHFPEKDHLQLLHQSPVESHGNFRRLK